MPAIDYETGGRKEPRQRQEDLHRIGDCLFMVAKGFDWSRGRGHGPPYKNQSSLSFTSLTRLPSCRRMRSSSPGRVCLAERMTRPSSARLTMA